MESPLLLTQSTRMALKQQIIQLCKSFSQTLQLQGDNKQTKTFFFSQANQFIESLIHLHSKEVNIFIKNHLKKVMQLINQGTFEQIPTLQILNDLKEYTKQKNLQREEVFNKLQTLFNYFLFRQCRLKTKLQIQNVQLEIQCSLNYTCPTCIKEGQDNGPQSLKNIDIQTTKMKNQDSRETKTMKHISYQETKENNSLSQNIKTQKPLIFKLNQSEMTQNLKKNWSTFGDLMGLQKFRVSRQSCLESDSCKSQRLYNELHMRNLHNQKAIKNFCKKVPNLFEQKQKSSLNLSNKTQQVQEQAQNLRPLNYFDRKKAHSLGFSNHLKLNRQHLNAKPKKNILKALANLHHSVQFDKFFNLSYLNQRQAQEKPIFATRKAHLEPNSARSWYKKARAVNHQEEDQVQKKQPKMQAKFTKIDFLPNLFEI